jgi:hypothetical protein
MKNRLYQLWQSVVGFVALAKRRRDIFWAKEDVILKKNGWISYANRSFIFFVFVFSIATAVILIFVKLKWV